MKKNLNEDWLKIRLEIFKKYTVPSILNQTNQDFEWIVYCHPDSPQWLIEELMLIDKVQVSFEYWYHKTLDLDTDILITSRVDSDDLLHKDYMKHIHEYTDTFIDSYFDQQVYTFNNGYVFDGKSITQVSNKRCPFHTLFSKTQDNKRNCQVYHHSHQVINGELPTFYNTEDTGWMYIRHEDQISGCDFEEKEPQESIDTLDAFGIKIPEENNNE